MHDRQTENLDELEKEIASSNAEKDEEEIKIAPSAEKKLKDKNVKTIDITDNYAIEIPTKFIDPYSQDIMVIPVLASDGNTYEASLAASALQYSNISALSGTHSLSKKFTFNAFVYNEIRDFFAMILERDETILNDGEHDEAFTKIKKYAEGINLGDDCVVDLIDFCEKKNITIRALEIHLPEYISDEEDENKDESAVDIAPAPVDRQDFEEHNRASSESSYVRMRFQPTHSRFSFMLGPSILAVNTISLVNLLLYEILDKDPGVRWFQDPKIWEESKLSAFVVYGIGTTYASYCSATLSCCFSSENCSYGKGLLASLAVSSGMVAASFTPYPWYYPTIAGFSAIAAIETARKIFHCVNDGVLSRNISSLWHRITRANSNANAIVEEERESLIDRRRPG